MPEALDEDRVRAIVAAQIKGAMGYDGDELSAQRTDNLERYEGDPYGTEREGRSQVISRDVMETVEAVMPSMVRTFLSADEVVTFDPAEQRDEEYAEQATDYVNYVLMKDNDGFRIAIDWMKSALITSTSVVKLWWDETDKTRSESYSQLTDEEFVELVADDTVEVEEHTAYATVEGRRIDPAEAALYAMQGIPVMSTHDVKIRKTETKKRLRWEAVPSEEFLINRRARTLNEDDNTFIFCCHRQARTIEELEAEGYDPEILARAPEHEDWFLDEAEERWDDVDYDDNLAEVDTSQRRVWVYECYLKVDEDGDGISELRRITVLGGASQTTILEDEEIYELPFADLCPVRLPYRFFGWTLADLTKDLQELKTAVWRQMMDGLYRTVNPHKIVNVNTVNLDDILSDVPGSFWGVDVPDGMSVDGHIREVASQWPGAQAFPMMEYIDRVLQSRSGVNDLAGGLDGGALAGETARGVEEAANSARARVELIARMFAQTGWTRLMRLALRMLNRHQDRARVLKLRGKWVSIDPRSWNTDMDVKINVGLGVGTKAEQFMKIQGILQKQEQLLQQFGPVNNPLVSLPQYHHSLGKLVEAADQEPDSFFTDPTDWVEQQKKQPPPPNPEMMKAQAEMQMKQQEAQAKLQQSQVESQARLEQSQAEAQLRAATDRERAQMDAEIARFKAEMDVQAQREAAQLKAAVDREIAANKLALERERMNMEHAYRMAELAEEKELEREKMRAGSPDGQGNINLTD